MNVLIVGSGGREHALSWRASLSGLVHRVYVAPGNPGCASEPNCENVDLAVDDFDGLVAFARTHDIGLTIVGPEAPLVEGIRDRFDAEELRCFAPSRAAAQLEGSKGFAKGFMQRHGIPTAGFIQTEDFEEAAAYIRDRGAPIVIKADGLAAGKGVTVAGTTEEALTAVRESMQERRFGDAGRSVVIEEFLQGEEASFIVATDGVNIVPFASSQDHKPVLDGDIGPNTGGMGVYSPAPVVTDAVHERIMEEIIRPTVAGMAADGTPYQGFLYAGLMILPDGSPHVIEFNCRFGDPEAQPVLARLRSDLVDLCLRALSDGLEDYALDFSTDTALGVVLASEGYPGSYETGHPISGLDDVQQGAKVFHAGTKDIGGSVVTAGGRVVCVVGWGSDIRDAQRVTYAEVAKVKFRGCHYRSDIGHRALARL